MIFEYTGTKESKKELRILLDNIHESDGHVTTYTIARMQGIHFGHKRLLDFAEEIGEKNILGLGSVQESGTLTNPFTSEQRIEMIRLLKGYNHRFSGNFSIVKLKDIGAATPLSWGDHTLASLEKMKLPRPNIYIGGSMSDIASNGFDNTDGILAISLDRYSSQIMSGTDVRKSIINGNSEWKDHVPYVLHKHMEESFPEELKLEYQLRNK